MSHQNIDMIICPDCGSARVPGVPVCRHCLALGPTSTPDPATAETQKMERPRPESHKAKATPKKRKPNKTEARYRAEHEQAGECWIYEGLRLPICGGMHYYTPDWLVMPLYGNPRLIEVKGNRHHQSHNRSQVAFAAAKEQYGEFFEFVWHDDKEIEP